MTDFDKVHFPLNILRRDTLNLVSYRPTPSDRKMVIGEDIAFQDSEALQRFADTAVERDITFVKRSGFLWLSSEVITEKMWVKP